MSLSKQIEKHSGWFREAGEQLQRGHQGQRDLHRAASTSRTRRFGSEQVCTEEGGFVGAGRADVGAGREDQLQAVCHTKGIFRKHVFVFVFFIPKISLSCHFAEFPASL